MQLDSVHYAAGAPGTALLLVEPFRQTLLVLAGYKAFCRQTLLGGNYELLDHNTYEPNPDFWAALLWRKTMGATILAASSNDESLRSYASCTPVSSITQAILPFACDL